MVSIAREPTTRTRTGRTRDVIVTPALYRCRVRHVRTEGVRNAFDYGVLMWLVDLDELPELSRWLRPVARFDARDHLGDARRSIRSNVDAFLIARGIDLRGGRVLTLTQARSFGYVFNPLTVHWCYDASGEHVCVVAEVHNTYGQRHCYLLRPDREGRAESDKEFYVSPFFPVDGRYVMRFSKPGEHVSVAITLHRPASAAEQRTEAGPARRAPTDRSRSGEDRAVFTATLDGERRPATTAELLRCLLRYPIGGFRVPALIRYQGVKLFLRKLPVVSRPKHTPQEDLQ